MSGQRRPGFHAIMMAAAYAEEGLPEHAREVLREGAGAPEKPCASGARAAGGRGLLAWLRPAAGRRADRPA